MLSTIGVDQRAKLVCNSTFGMMCNEKFCRVCTCWVTRIQINPGQKQQGRFTKFPLSPKSRSYGQRGGLGPPWGRPGGNPEPWNHIIFSRVQLSSCSTAYNPNFRFPSIRMYSLWPRSGFCIPRGCLWMPPELQGMESLRYRILISTAQVPKF